MRKVAIAAALSKAGSSSRIRVWTKRIVFNLPNFAAIASESPITSALSEGTPFSLVVIWRGDPKLWQEIVSLFVVWANLGSWGFHSRRTAGAIRLKSAAKPLGEAFQSFRQAIAIQSLPIRSGGTWRSVSESLLRWYRGWRQHGRSQDLRPGNRDKLPPENDGFIYARRDHDIGYQLPAVTNQPAFRPALGLPIIQRTNRGTRNWEWSNDGGRFASPVLLRPHKDAQGNWHPLVIFVEALNWPANKQVFLNGHPRAVSLDLSEAMKNDPQLTPWFAPFWYQAAVVAGGFLVAWAQADVARMNATGRHSRLTAWLMRGFSRLGCRNRAP